MTAACRQTEPLPDPPRSVIDEQIARDKQLLEMLTLRCDECRRYGPAKDGRWRVVSGLVLCEACAEIED